MRVTHVFSSPVADATGTLTVWAGSTTASAIATDMVRPTNWNSAHGLIQDIGGNTLGVSSVSGSNIVLAGGANITLSGVQGANVGSVTIIGGTGEVGTGTTFGGTNISGSMTLNSAGLALSLSGGAGGGAGSMTVSAGTSSAALDSIVFSNSNRVSFGLDGSTITASINARASNDGIGLNTAQTNVTWTVNSSGLSLNAAGYAGTGTTFGGTNISGSITQNSNGIALSLSGLAALTSQSNQALSAANGSFTFQTAQFSNANGVSFVTSAGSAIAASVVTTYVQPGFTSTTTAGTAIVGTLSTNGLSLGVPAFLTTARGSTDGIGLNTAQTNVTWTVNSSGLSLNAAGYAGTGTTFNGANISGSITQNSVGLNLSLSVADPAAAAVNFSAGTTSNNLTQVVFSNSNGVSFGLNGSTITASAAGGGGGATLSQFSNGPALAPFNLNGFLGNGSSIIFPYMVPEAVSFDIARALVTISTNSTTRATSADTTISMRRDTTWNHVIYTMGSGASSQSLQSVSSVSILSAMAFSLSANSNGSQYTVSQSITYPSGSGSTSSYSTSYASSQTNYALHTTNLTAFTACRVFDVPLAGLLPAANYWMMTGWSTAQTTVQNAAWSNWVAGVQSMFGFTQTAEALGYPGQASNATLAVGGIGNGMMTTNVQGTTASIALSRITSNAVNMAFKVELMRFA